MPSDFKSSKAICSSRSSRCVAAKLHGLRRSNCPRPRKPVRAWAFRSKPSPSSWACRRALCRTGSKAAASPRARQRRCFASQSLIRKFCARCTHDARAIQSRYGDTAKMSAYIIADVTVANEAKMVRT